MTHTPKIRVAIHCSLSDARHGVGTALLALAKALSEAPEKNQEYTFVVSDAMRSWLEPHIFGPCKLQPIASTSRARQVSGIKSFLRRSGALRALWKVLRKGEVSIPSSDGSLEAQGFDVIHFPTQLAFRTPIPSIYQPWDLQHIHYPEFFTLDEFKKREVLYRTFCRQAAYVCVQAEWTKRDVIKQFGLPEAKVAVIPWGSVFTSYSPPSAATQKATIEKYGLPEKFFFYPAVTWKHKNHRVILEALHLLSKEGKTVHVYFTGASTEFQVKLLKLAEDLGIGEQVHFLGFVSSGELQSIFQAATAMLFPSKFEGFGLPILEAFHAGVPVLSSNATTLPEVGEDAALYFDPDSPSELAELMVRLMDHPELRPEMIRKGRETLSRFDIQRTASDFQDLYRRVAEETRALAAMPES